MSEDYSQNLVKKYHFWSIYVHDNQGYLGRCVVWCHRENALDLGEATPEEQKELFLVLNELRQAAQQAFAPDWFNYAFLGNGVRHLHGHFIPRYNKPKQFLGKTFTDDRWGHNYRTDHSFVTTEALRLAVRDSLRASLN